MPKGVFDDQKIDIPCPECRRQTATRIGKLKRDPHVVCACGARIDVDAQELLRELKQVEKSLSNLDIQIKF